MPSQGTSTFDLFALRLHCAAAEPVHFKPGETANLFRGQLGKILHRTNPELYARFFAPVGETRVPSGLRDPPRPFVLRVRHLEGATLRSFQIGLNVFETNHPDPVSICKAIDDLAHESLRAEVCCIEGLDILRLALPDVARASRRAASTVVSMCPDENPPHPTLPARYRAATAGSGVQPPTPPKVSTCRITFLTPTELKNQKSPEFDPLFARIRDRISTLRALYGQGPLEIDFKAIAQRAEAIRMTHCELYPVAADRTSYSTKQRHNLSGFVGFAEYEGDLAEFIPYLEIASYTGVGRQTVWGKGEISVETF
jgi:hypothetical protein